MAHATTGSNWYTNAYGGAFRTTRLRAPSYLASGSRPIIQIQQTLVVDAARNTTAAGEKEGEKTGRRRETIFGPDVGEDDEPGWTKPDEGAKVGVDVVKGWVDRAKAEEGLHATTTLQALVNLKRPTLQLMQLDDAPAADIAPAAGGDTDSRRDSIGAPPLHVLKFNYDSTTPSVNITLSIYPTPAPVIEGKEDVVEAEEPKVIYNGIHAGGFNQLFSLPESAALDLSSTIAPMPVHGDSASQMNDDKESAKDIPAVRESEDTTRSSIAPSTAMAHRNSTQAQLQTVPELEAAPAAEERRPRRFGLFGRRQREPDVEEAAGIELQMQQQQASEEEKKEEEEKEMERGMRLLIRIDAMGDDGQVLKTKNCQLTHILINGMWASADGTGGVGKRVWVVKVVRREAVIGAHTFLLKEIYGLSSSSSSATQATSYPPTAGLADDPYASTPNECIVCLTSPRDVVLLPCRHLVVCRECAVGMVEFGAGGKVGRREEAPPATEAPAADATATGEAGADVPPAAPAPQVSGGTTTGGRERRKKKPKGWYCPVCRQPYTSLLRLALPTSAKPLRTPAASRLASRAPSVRSLHMTNAHAHPHAHNEEEEVEHDLDHHSLRRVPSHAPTLPDGAERMLESLHPDHGVDHDDDVSDDEAEVEQGVVPQDERPQFILGDEEDAKHATGHPPAVEGEGTKEIEDGMEEIDLGDSSQSKKK